MKIDEDDRIIEFLTGPRRTRAEYDELMIDVRLTSLKVCDLKNFLCVCKEEDPSISVSGRKAQLIERLEQWILARLRPEQSTSSTSNRSAKKARIAPVSGRPAASEFSTARVSSHSAHYPVGMEKLRWSDEYNSYSDSGSDSNSSDFETSMDSSVLVAPAATQPFSRPHSTAPAKSAAGPSGLRTGPATSASVSSSVPPVHRGKGKAIITTSRSLAPATRAHIAVAGIAADSHYPIGVVGATGDRAPSQPRGGLIRPINSSGSAGCSAKAGGPVTGLVKKAVTGKGGPPVPNNPFRTTGVVVPSSHDAETRHTELYRDLRQAGFTDDQAVGGISVCGGAEEADFDSVMLHIVSEMQKEEGLDEELEDEDLTAVILLSEGERDVIANRKRRREDELQHDCQCPLRSADELKGSYLLFGLPDRLRVACQPAGGSGTENNSCLGVIGILELLQSYAANCVKSTKSDESCTCPAAVLGLRTALTSLLMLETKAIVWYQANAAAYVHYITERLDIAYRTHLAVGGGVGGTSAKNWTLQNMNGNSGSSSRGISSSSSSSSSNDRSIGSLVELTAAVQHEVERLQQALFAIPENDCGIPGPPQVFVDCFKRLGLSRDVLGHQPDLEEDGLEIIE